MQILPAAPVCVTLEFRCLGSFVFSGGNGWCAAPARARGGEFLAYLASHRRSPVLRDALSEAFWPDLDAEQSMHRLHLAASGARAAVRAEMPNVNPIVFLNDCYAWNSLIQIQSDTDRLEVCFNDGTLSALSEGVRIYGGKFLAGDPADWILPMRIRYEQMYVTMLEALARAALQVADYGRATNFALQLIEVDRANERGTQLAMLSSANAGHRSTALAEFDNLERYLKKWLGVEPMASTRRLREQILKGEVAEDPSDDERKAPKTTERKHSVRNL
jgi:DNA-binding SARP family transcriptional activator